MILRDCAAEVKHYRRVYPALVSTYFVWLCLSGVLEGRLKLPNISCATLELPHKTLLKSHQTVKENLFMEEYHSCSGDYNTELLDVTKSQPCRDEASNP